MVPVGRDPTPWLRQWAQLWPAISNQACLKENQKVEGGRVLWGLRLNSRRCGRKGTGLLPSGEGPGSSGKTPVPTLAASRAVPT